MDIVVVICTSLSLLNASILLFVKTFSVGWPVVVIFYCRDLYIVVATPFSDCASLFAWPSLDLLSCFATVSDRPFSVQDCGVYVPVYSFDAFETISMVVVWTCGDVGLWINHYLFFLLG